MKFGYARVSTIDQNPGLQLDALKAAGCDPLFVDHASGADEGRPELARLMSQVGKGDVVTVWRVDRLGRSLPHLLELVGDLNAKGAHLVSLTEALDTTTAHGRMIFQLVGVFAEFERSLLSERTKAGQAAARARGAKLGRRAVLSRSQLDHARQLIAGGESVTSVARSLKVGRSTLYRALETRQQGSRL